MRFFKVFLISLAVVVGFVGIGFGILAVQGRFTHKPVRPESIFFDKSIYEVDGDFEIVIGTPTADVTEKRVMLNFARDEQAGEVDSVEKFEGKISNNKIIVPEYVTIGQPFKVELVKSVDPELNMPWVNGGVSTLRATSQGNVEAKAQTAKIFVDVPVFSLNIETSALLGGQNQSEFDINSRFNAKVNFVPQRSAFMYSKDGSNGREIAHKGVFFNTLDQLYLEKIENQEPTELHSAQFLAKQKTESAKIDAYAFATAGEQERVLAALEGIENQEDKFTYILGQLVSGQANSISVQKDVKVSELVVGKFDVNNFEFRTKLNTPVTIFANKPNNGTQSHFDLGANILASDQETVMPNQLTSIGLALAFEADGGLVPATSQDFAFYPTPSEYRQVVAQLYGHDFTFHLPIRNLEDVGSSYWEITALKPNLNAYLLVVLFESDKPDAQINPQSLEGEGVKNRVEVKGSAIVTERVYWENYFESPYKLYIEVGNGGGDKFYNYNFDNPTEGMARAFVPATNAYSKVVYFAYLEKDGRPATENDPEKIENYINVTSNKVWFNNSHFIYEIENGNLVPNSSQLPNNYLIRVLFATVVTNQNNIPVLTPEGEYQLDKISSDEDDNLQTISFEIVQVLNVLQASVEFAGEDVAFDGQTQTLAAVHNTDNAFNIVFDFADKQGHIDFFERDYNLNKIEVRFLINGQVSDRFSYLKEQFILSDNKFKLSVDIDEIVDFSAGIRGGFNFEIELVYLKGDQIAIYPVTLAYFNTEDGVQTINNAKFEVYDGHIATLEFASADQFENVVTSASPIQVETELIPVQGERNGNFLYASPGSTNSLTHNNLLDVKQLLFKENTSTVNILAFDKYGKPVTYQSGMWELVSSNSNVVSVSGDGQSVNFEGSTLEGQSVEVSIQSLNYGINKNKVSSAVNIYFEVISNGRLAEVATRAPGAAEYSVVHNYAYNYVAEQDGFTLDDSTQPFDNRVIKIELEGQAGRSVYLSEANQNNVLRLLYALPHAVHENLFDIFDLTYITKFYHSGSVDFSGFINFEEDGNGAISMFTIAKNFGAKGTLLLKAETEIGLNFDLEITINQYIDASIPESYSHAGAAEAKIGANTYVGVYSEFEVNIEVEVNHNLSNVRVLVYDYNTKQVLAMQNDVKSSPNSITFEDGVYKLSLYMPDVAANTLRHLVFVLDSLEEVNWTNYSRSMFDFALDIYLNVNPNAKAVVNTQLENLEILNQGTQEQKIVLKMPYNNFENFVAIDHGQALQSVFLVSGITQRLNSLKILDEVGMPPYVHAYITDSQGSRAVTNTFVGILENTLTIKAEINQKINFYVAVVHQISSQQKFVLGVYYMEIVPDIAPSQDFKQSFIVYGGREQLQLITTPGQDEHQISGGEKASYALNSGNAVTLADMFVSEFGSGQTISVQVLGLGFEGASPTQSWRLDESGQVIELEARTVIYENDLVLKVRIANVGTVEFPVLLMPLKAPFVQYSESLEDNGEGVGERNAQANKDVKNLLSINYLQQNNIYDLEIDAQQSIDIKQKLLVGSSSFQFFLRDDIHSQLSSAVVGNINTSDGTLKLFVVGQDAFIIVVARYLSGLEIYYRIKVKASAQIQTFYPYADNYDSQEQRVEYLYLNGNSTVDINFADNFAHSVPARGQLIQNIKQLDQNEQYIDRVEYITSRFELLRQLNTPGTYELLPLNINSIKVNSIKMSNGALVAVENWPAYFTQDQTNLKRFVFKQNGSYTVEFEVVSDVQARTNYFVEVRPNKPNFEIVNSKDGGDISTMPVVPANYKIKINSPEAGDLQPNQATDLLTMLLKESVGANSSNKTQLLRYYIYNDSNNILSVDSNGTIYAEFTPNKINAKVMLYTKHGVVAVYDVEVAARIYVADPNAIENEKLNASVFAGTVFDFNQVIEFAQLDKDDVPTRFIDNENVVWTSVRFEGFEQGTPAYINRHESEKQKLYILPLAQNTTVTHKLFVVAQLSDGLGGEQFDFEFEFNLEIKSALEANISNSADLPADDQNIAEIKAGDLLSVEFFNHFYKNESGQDITISKTTEGFVATHGSGDELFSYQIELSSTNAPDLIDWQNITVQGGHFLVFPTKAVASETVVILKAKLSYEQNSYYMALEAFYQFKLNPDSTLLTNYPVISAPDQPDGEVRFGDERVVAGVGNPVNLNAANLFSTKPRVEILDYDGSTLTDFANVYVQYKIVSGETANFTVTGGENHPNGTGYSFNSNFNFQFVSEPGKPPTFDFAEVAFEVFVNNISRITYTVFVHQKVNAVYGVKVNPINPLEQDSREVFYLGEDKKEIFAGVQAVNFVVDSYFNRTVEINLYKRSASGSNDNLGMKLNISATDAGRSVTLKVPQELDVRNFLDLTLDNIIFEVVHNGNSEGFKTLSQLMSQAGRPFAVRPNGNANFQLLRRVEATYLGYEIADDNFLKEINFVENQSAKYDKFTILHEGLGGDVRQRQGDVEIRFGSQSAGGDNSLGSYAYIVKANFVVKNTEAELIVSGQAVQRGLDYFGIEKLTGEKFVVYDAQQNPIVDSLISQGKIAVRAYLERQDNDPSKDIIYKHALTGLPYTHQAAVEPLFRSDLVLFGQDIIYDFSLMANGAPNDGIKAFLIFEYTYIDPDNADNNILFSQKIVITILPSWQVQLRNRFTPGSNSISTPEIITSQAFTDKMFNYTFIDARDGGVNSSVLIRKPGDAANKNYAVDNFAIKTYNFATVEPVLDAVNNQIIAKNLILNQPSFQELDFAIELVDDFGYKVLFYFVLYPETRITYQGMQSSSSKIFEGDLFKVKHALGQGQEDNFDQVDHLILLSTQTLNPSEIEVRYTLLNGFDNQEIKQINTSFEPLSNISAFNFLDSELFSKTQNNIYVKLKIELSKTSGVDEVYTIISLPFYLHQRYVTQIGNNAISDGRETNLINHIDIRDMKFELNLGVPKLTDDKTLVVKDKQFEGSLTVKAFAGSVVREQIATVEAENKMHFISMASLFKQEISDVLGYAYLVREVDDTRAGNKVKISISGNGAKIHVTNTSSSYVVHLFDGYEYRDVVVAPGSGETDGVSLPLGQNFGIIGYEKVVTQEEVMFKVVKVESQDGLRQQLNLSTGGRDIGFEITLTNKDTFAQIKTITVTQKTATTYNLNYKASDQSSQTIEGLTLEYDEDNLTYIIKFYQDQGTNIFDLNKPNENWVITGYKLNQLESVDSLLFVTDKKVSVATIDTKDGDSVKVYFTGLADNYLEVDLNKNDVQEFSALEHALQKGYTLQNFNASHVELRYPNALDLTDLTKIKGVVYFNDTVEIKVKMANSSGVVGFRIVKNQDISQAKTFNVNARPFANTHTIGLSYIFNDQGKGLVKEGDEFELAITSVPSSALEYIKITWPNGSFVNLTDFNNKTPAELSAMINKYVFNGFDDQEIIKHGGAETINLDSVGQYNYYTTGENRFVNVTRYYLMQFNDGTNKSIHLVDPVEFKVSPHYYGIDASKVLNLQNYVMVGDYAQVSTDGNNLTYIAEFRAWAKDIVLLDAYNNPVKTDEGVLTLLEAYENSSVSNIKFYPASGSLTINSNGDLEIRATHQNDIHETYFIIDVLVALNGENIGQETEWLKIGSVPIAFSSHKHYFLESGSYTISTTKTDGDHYIKYLEIDSASPVTFNLNKIFQDDTLNIENVTTLKAQQSLENVYLTDKVAFDYQISYLQNHLEVNAVLASQVLAQPVIAVSNLAGDDSGIIRFKLQLSGGQVHTGQFTNTTSKTMFGQILLDQILVNTQDGQTTFEALIQGESDYQITPDGTNAQKAKVYWSVVNLTKLKDVNLSFFGDGENTTDYETIINVIKASPMFKLTKLQQAHISTVSVTVDARISETQNREVLIAATQIAIDGDNKPTHAQTMVYKLVNNTNAVKTFDVELFEMVENQGFTKLVIVEKLGAFGLYGPSLFNTKNVLGVVNNYMSYQIGHTKQSDLTFTQRLEVIKAGQEYAPHTVDLSSYYLFDDILTSVDQANGTTATVLTTYLPFNLVDGVATVSKNMLLDSEKDYNIITTDNAFFNGNLEAWHTYQYLAASDEGVNEELVKLDFEIDKTNLAKIILSQTKSSTNSLIWHNFKVKQLPIDDSVYLDYYDAELETTETRKVARQADGNLNILMKNNDIISNMWNGLMFVSEFEQLGEWAKVTYNKQGAQGAAQNDEVVYIKVDAYKHGRNHIKLGEIIQQPISLLWFDRNFDHDLPENLDREKQAIVALNENISVFGGSGGLSDGRYKVSYGDKVYALLNYTGQPYTVFDLIVAPTGENEITSIFKQDVSVDLVLTSDLNWEVEDVPSAGDTDFYAISQQLTGRFAVIEITATSTSYNLFEALGTDVLLAADGDITISKISMQIVIMEADSNPGVSGSEELYAMLEQGSNKIASALDVEIQTAEKFEAIVYLDQTTHKNFLLSLTSDVIDFYITDGGGNAIDSVIAPGSVSVIDRTVSTINIMEEYA